MNLEEKLQVIILYIQFYRFELFFNIEPNFYDILLKYTLLYGDDCKFVFLLRVYLFNMSEKI